MREARKGSKWGPDAQDTRPDKVDNRASGKSYWYEIPLMTFAHHRFERHLRMDYFVIVSGI